MHCTSSDRPSPVVGLILVTLGLALALDRLGILEAARILAYWPIVLVAIGAWMMVRAIGGMGGGGSTPAHGDLRSGRGTEGERR